MTNYSDKYREQRSVDPDDLYVDPERRVRDLKTVDECARAVLRLEIEISRIVSQIARYEENPEGFRQGWKGTAQAAIRWKNSAVKAVKAHSVMLAKATHRPSRKGATILKIIREDIGEAKFEEYVATARRLYPDAFAEASDG